jgi:hypothetical protein
MLDIITKFKIENESLAIDGDKVIIALQNANDEEVNFATINKDGTSSYHKELSGEFTVIGDSFDDKLFFTQSPEDAFVINRVTGATAIIYFEPNNCASVIKAFYEHGCPNESVILLDSTASSDDINTVNEASKPYSLVSNYQHTEFNNLADMAIKKGLPSVTSAIHDISELSKPKATGITFKRVTDLGDIKGVDWLIEDVLQTNGFINIFGPSGHCKSFVALDMACSMASGKDWHGLETQKNAVLYVCGEGEDGINARIKAWQYENKHTGELDVFMTDDPVRLLNDGYYDKLVSSIKALVEATGVDIKTIVFDTMNRCFGDGDENSTKDMTMFTDACIDLRRETGMSVVVVHHTSVSNPRQARGNGSLKASLETEINVLKPANEAGETYGYVEMNITKQKNGVEMAPMYFMPEILNLGQDLKGRDVTSLVMKSGSHINRIVEDIKNEEIENNSKGKSKPKSAPKISPNTVSINLNSAPKQKHSNVIGMLQDNGGAIEMSEMIPKLMNIYKDPKLAKSVIQEMLKDGVVTISNKALTLA